MKLNSQKVKAEWWLPRLRGVGKEEMSRGSTMGTKFSWIGVRGSGM